MIFTKKFDIHSIHHFLGCYALVPTFMCIFKMPITWASIFTFILAFGWEALDELNKRKSLNIKVLDPRGGDYTDLLVDTIAIIFACFIFG